jgi:YD repeat-containing protein
MTKMVYSALGDVISVTDPKGNITSSSYDLNRRVSAVITAFAYDPDGRVLETTRSAAGLTSTSKATYTRSGQPASATDANGNITRYSYDVVDRLSSVNDPLAE